ncbi:hypothetical protein NZ30_13710 [Xanthomonas translucens pv. undulosa]|nr:hypothetical protein NZ30_13710 [Xanthomonas translucens pv. undulosa]
MVTIHHIQASFYRLGATNVGEPNRIKLAIFSRFQYEAKRPNVLLAAFLCPPFVLERYQAGNAWLQSVVGSYVANLDQASMGLFELFHYRVVFHGCLLMGVHRRRAQLPELAATDRRQLILGAKGTRQRKMRSPL